MDEKIRTRIYEADVMALPPLRLVLGSVPSPDPDRRQRPEPKLSRETPETTLMVVRRLITHLEEKK